MGCRSDYLEPTARELESVRVLEFLREINGLDFDHDNPHFKPYGNTEQLDSDTESLCGWCSTNDVSKSSLELQLWWQKHQKHDQLRQEREAIQQKNAALRKAALAKLNREELKILGLKR